MCNSQHLWKAQWSRYSKCESVKNNYHLLLHGQSTDSEWEAKRESVKHNLRLLLDPVSVFKGQTLKNRCHCFQTVICTKEDCGLSHNVSVRFKDIKMLSISNPLVSRWQTCALWVRRLVWSGSNRVLQSLYNAYQQQLGWALREGFK